MSIQMIGIDHIDATIDQREVFSLSSEEMVEMMLTITNKPGVEGCIILSTCNRMEIWVNTHEEYIDCIYDTLCDYKNIDRNVYRNIFKWRCENEAVEHLYCVASALKSKIIGEDQILTQVKEALKLSREHECANKVLGVLFENAIMVGKKIKTELELPKTSVSIVNRMIDKLKEDGITFDGKKCMVIGNGIMGKEVARGFCKEGADVTFTIRQYKNDSIEIPEGCSSIHYDERIRFLTQCNIVVSATSSLNYTMEKNCISNISLTKEVIMIDLAVPRDIEPCISDLPGITLYNIDDFKSEEGITIMEEYKDAVKNIIATEIEKFLTWYEYRNIIPNIKRISSAVSADTILRVRKTLKMYPKNEQHFLEKTIERAVGKVMDKLIFGLRSQVELCDFYQCIKGFETVYQIDNDAKEA